MLRQDTAGGAIVALAGYLRGTGASGSARATSVPAGTYRLLVPEPARLRRRCLRSRPPPSPTVVTATLAHLRSSARLSGDAAPIEAWIGALVAPHLRLRSRHGVAPGLWQRDHRQSSPHFVQLRLLGTSDLGQLFHGTAAPGASTPMHHANPRELDWLSAVRVHPLNEALTRVALPSSRLFVAGLPRGR